MEGTLTIMCWDLKSLVRNLYIEDIAQANLNGKMQLSNSLRAHPSSLVVWVLSRVALL
jgi:hypothetical protein